MKEKVYRYEYVLTLHHDPTQGFIVDLRIDKCDTDGDVFDSAYEEGFIFDAYKEAFEKYVELYAKYEAMEGELQPDNQVPPHLSTPHPLYNVRITMPTISANFRCLEDELEDYVRDYIKSEIDNIVWDYKKLGGKDPWEVNCITNKLFWDCNCSENYIHKKIDRLTCPVCKADEDECPDSRQVEIDLGTHFANSK